MRNWLPTTEGQAVTLTLRLTENLPDCYIGMIKEVKITVPTELKEITLKQFQDWRNALDKNQDNDTFIRKKTIQFFCKVPLVVVDNMSRKDFINVSNHLFNILSQKRGELVRHFNLRGKEFGFIPQLDADHISVAEYVDLDTFFEDWNTFHKAMAVLYRPVKLKVKDKYKIEKYKADGEYDEAMREVGMDVVIGAQTFFLTLGRELLTITPKYLSALIQQRKELQTVLEKNGAGINMFLHSLEEACSNLTALLDSRLEPLLPFLRSPKTTTTNKLSV